MALIPLAGLIQSCAPVMMKPVPVTINIKKSALTAASLGYSPNDHEADYSEPMDPSQLCFFVNVTGPGVPKTIESGNDNGGTCSHPFLGIGQTSQLAEIGGEVSLSLPIGLKTLDLLAFEKSSFDGTCPAGSMEIREVGGEPLPYFNGVAATTPFPNYDSDQKPYFFGRAEANVAGGLTSIVTINVETSEDGSSWNAYNLGCDRGGGGEYPRVAFKLGAGPTAGPLVHQFSSGNQLLLLDEEKSNVDSCSIVEVKDSAGNTAFQNNFSIAAPCNLSINDTTPTNLNNGRYRVKIQIDNGSSSQEQELLIVRGTLSQPLLVISKYKFEGDVNARPLSGGDLRKEFSNFPNGTGELILEIKNLGAAYSSSSSLVQTLTPYGFNTAGSIAYNGFQWGNASGNILGTFPGATTSITGSISAGFSTDTVCNNSTLAANATCLLKLKLTNNPGEHHISFMPHCSTPPCISPPHVSISYSLGSYNSGLGRLIIEANATDPPNFDQNIRNEGGGFDVLDSLFLTVPSASLGSSYYADLVLVNVGNSPVRLPAALPTSVANGSAGFAKSDATDFCLDNESIPPNGTCVIRYWVMQDPASKYLHSSLLYDVLSNAAGNELRYKSDISLGVEIYNFPPP